MGEFRTETPARALTRVVGAVSLLATSVAGTVLFAGSSSATPAPAVSVAGNHLVDASGAPLVLRGVDLSGTEFACIQGGTPTSRGWSIYGDQPLDQASTYQAMQAWHVNAVRVPLNEDCWLGINGVNPAYGGSNYQAAIAAEVSQINAAGMVAVLDLHWSSPGTWAAYAQNSMADADHSITFWQSVAGAFKSDPSVVFDLFNEPFFYYIASGGPDQWTCWLEGCTQTTVVTGGQVGPNGQTTGYTTSYIWQSAGMQQLVNAVRSTGATQPILVNGVDWANDLSGWLAHEPVDPDHQLVAGWHSYPGQPCAVISCWTSVIAPVAAQVPVLVGETGDSSAGPETYLPTFLPWADSEGLSYLAWTWNPWQDGSNVLIQDWTGTPTTGEGAYYQSHLAAMAEATGGGFATPTSSPTTTSSTSTTTSSTTTTTAPPPPSGGSTGAGIVLRATATAPSSSGAGNSITVTIPPTAQSGDVAVVQVDDNGPSGQQVSAPAGWALVPGASNPVSPTSTLTTWLYYKVMSASDPGTSVTWSWSGSLWGSAVLADYGSVDSASPFDGDATSGGSSTSASVGGVTTTTAGDELTAWAVSVGGPSLTSANATQEASEEVQQNAGEWDAAQAVAGPSGTFSWSLSSSHSWTTAVLALRPAAGPQGTTPPPVLPGLSIPTGVGINVEPSYRPWRWAGGPNPDSWWDPTTGSSRMRNELALVAQAHAATVRLEFPWAFLEPSRGAFDFSRADQIVQQATADGVSLQAVLVWCPSWEGAPNCVPNPQDYAAFASAVAARYKGVIHVFEMGNEPDVSRYFSGSESQWVSTMLNPGYAAVKAVDPTDVVVSSGMAYPTNLGWIDTEKADGARFDVQAYHDYPGSASQVNSDGLALRQRMNADGYTQPLWLDEFGTQQDSTRDSSQQSWLTTVMSPGANPATHIDWYNLRDDLIYCSATSVCTTNYYGIATDTLAQKAAFATFTKLATAANG